ncbi:MAG: DnaJ domain-containing protein [Pseudanabaenaceae cyanobacterium SKYGB_i_bin29]|nr:DnaJ domain-containing protein [Pseudanabaenaceae cyanobacterium SKYG29]MDW8420639.1 DnaJ domain-containing protein [Pseudanabaenaceae cyanobacterium SKYGB_i_bin29]
MQPADCYRVLGLARNASWEDVKIAYRRLARKYHPDVNQGDPQAAEKFRLVQEAYQVLRTLQAGATPSNHTRPAPPPPPPKPTVKVEFRPPTPKTKEKVPPSPAERLLQDTLQRVQLLFRQKKYPVAMAMLEGLRQRFPDHSEVIKWLAVAYQRQGNELLQIGKYREAEIYLRKALQTAPHNRALCFEVQHDLDRLARLK